MWDNRQIQTNRKCKNIGMLESIEHIEHVKILEYVKCNKTNDINNTLNNTKNNYYANKIIASIWLGYSP